MKNLLVDACSQLNINLSQKQVEQFFQYKDLLLEWNEKINLTAITDEREVILKHFVDCISILNEDEFKAKKVIDVGTGAGFPGLPVKIACPEVELTLLDSLNKRINFLQCVIDSLGLENVECIHSRAEDGGREPKLREKFDLCVSRAVANLASLSEYCLPFVKVGGRLIALKGPSAEEEAENAKVAIDVLGGKITQIKDVNIPFSDLNHTVVIIEKVRQTPAKYPRKSTKISKNPIK